MGAFGNNLGSDSLRSFQKKRQEDILVSQSLPLLLASERLSTQKHMVCNLLFLWSRSCGQVQTLASHLNSALLSPHL